MLLSGEWWPECRYVISLTSPTAERIRYADAELESPALGEIYECVDNMVGKVKHIIR